MFRRGFTAACKGSLEWAAGRADRLSEGSGRLEGMVDVREEKGGGKDKRISFD